jgi:hypothetical protein
LIVLGDLLLASRDVKYSWMQALMFILATPVSSVFVQLLQKVHRLP